jgi:hypothetical protein
MGHLLPLGTVLQARYRITGIVGEGATGVVYVAEDLKIPGVRWAIKGIAESLLDEDEKRDALAMFAREASLLKKLNHTGLPKVIEDFSDGQSHYLVMEFIEGESLQKKCKERGGKLSLDEILPWMLQVLDILDYLHSHEPPVIFRDLKPSNIMITSGGKVKLIDFGIARLFVPGKMRDTHIMGTPGFSAPEQYGSQQTDHRSDLYALGATMYFLLSGEDPERFNFEFPPITSFNDKAPEWLSAVLARALQREPGQRFSSAALMKAQMVQDPDDRMALSGSPPQAPPQHAALDIFSSPWKAFYYCFLLLCGTIIPCIGPLSGIAGFAGFAALAIYSLGAIVFHIFRKEFRAALSSGALLLTSCLFLIIPAAIAIPGYYRSRDQSMLTCCKANLRSIGTALEMYAGDNDRHFPPDLEKLSPRYLKVIPSCEKAMRDYYGAYIVNADADIYTIFCRGEFHKSLLGQPDYPQCDSIHGIIVDPREL